jgi:hypothetical protein
MVLPLDGEDDGPIPLVYLACRLTNISSDLRKLLDSWCTHVQEAITEAADESAKRWEVAVHAPIAWSAPWTDQRPPEEIYQLNSTTVSGCSAVIILCVDGGGLGVGQEFAWAVALRLPILILHPHDLPLTRQALGTPGDLTIVGFTTAVHLANEVKAFLRKNRPVIEDWHRRRASLDLSLLPLRETIAERWHELSAVDKERVEAESRVHQQRIRQLTSDEHALAGASLSEILALLGAMGIESASIFAGPSIPELSGRQRDALGVAADEYEWRGAEVLALETRARLELARGGTRRMNLSTPADWVHFREQTIGRD